MADLGNMKLSVTGDVNDLLRQLTRGEKSIGDFERQLKTFKTALTNATDPARIITLNRAIESTTNKLKTLTTAGQQANQALNSGAVQKAGKDFTGLSRVIQDLPFGFIGIQNNITQLLPAAGALGLAVSVLTSAVTFAITGFSNWTRGLGSNKDVVDRLKKDYEDLGQAIKQSNEEAGKEIADLKILYATATNVANSTELRLSAVKQLKKEFPDYFAGIKNETILNGGAKKAYDELSESIVKSARARAAKGRIDAIEAEKLNIAFQKEKINNATANEAARVRDKVLNSGTGGGSFGLGGGGSVTITRKEQLAIIEQRRKGALAIQEQREKELNAQEDFLIKFAGGEDDLTKVILDNNKDRTEALKGIPKILDELRKSLRGLSAEFANGFIDQKKFDEGVFGAYQTAVKGLAELRASPSLIRGLTFEFDFVNAKYNIDERDLAAIGDALKKSMAGLMPVELTGIRFTLPKDLLGNIDKRAPNLIPKNFLTDFQKQIIDMNNNLAKIIDTTFENAYVSIGEGIAEALTSGANIGERVFGSLFKTIGTGLKEFGKSLIALGLAKEALEKLGFAPGVGTVAAGIAAIIAGSLVQKAVPKFATGGIMPFDGIARVNERGGAGELIQLPGGSKIIPSHKAGDYAGGGVYIPNAVIRGQDIVISYNRATASNKING